VQNEMLAGARRYNVPIAPMLKGPPLIVEPLWLVQSGLFSLSSMLS
jgi:hypothetical protein